MSDQCFFCREALPVSIEPADWTPGFMRFMAHAPLDVREQVQAELHLNEEYFRWWLKNSNRRFLCYCCYQEQHQL